MAKVNVVAPSTKKEALYKGIKEVAKEDLGQGKYKFTAKMDSGSSFSLEYRENGKFDDVLMEHWDINGKYAGELNPRQNKQERYGINRNNTGIAINELLYNLERIYNNLPAEVGEFNHFYLMKWQKRSGGEVFSVNAGDIVTKELNNAHGALAQKIERISGLKCAVFSYYNKINNPYSLLGMDCRKKEQRTLFKNEVSKFIQSGDLRVIK